MKCEICKDEGWTCEFHPDKAWEDGQGCCGGAGMLCVCLIKKMSEYADSLKLGEPYEINNHESCVLDRIINKLNTDDDL